MRKHNLCSCSKNGIADLPPVTDPVPETYPEPICEKYKGEEAAARRELYLFVKLGHWFAKLPLTLAMVGFVTTFYVRAREKYPFRYWQRTKFWLLAAIAASVVLVHLLLAPNWFPEWRFPDVKPRRPWYNRYLRPLFGWPVYSAAWVLFAMIVAALWVLGRATGPIWHAFRTLGLRGGFGVEYGNAELR